MQLEVGKIYTGIVKGITKFGAFVELEPGKTGMVHISEVANTYVSEIKDHLTEGQEVKVKLLSVGDNGKMSLSIKKAVDNPPPRAPRPQGGAGTGGFQKKDGQGGGGFQKRDFNKPKPAAQEPVFTGNPDQYYDRKQNSGDAGFEDMLSRFKQNSDERMGDLKKVIDNRRKGGSRRGGGQK